VNKNNTPMAYSFAGPVMNPWNNLDENHKEWFKSNEKKLNERTSMWFDIHPNPFKCPIPCLSSENFSHVSREEFFEFSQIQVLQHSPRVGAGHTDFGFGWLYVVKGIKLLLFVEEMTRKVASTDPHTPGCSIHSTWDLDVLSRLNNVKYFILQPGSIAFIPASVKHLVFSPYDSQAYGGFVSHMYGALSDLAYYLDMHRETNTDFATLQDATRGSGIQQTTKLIKSIIEQLQLPQGERLWEMKKAREIVCQKADSFISNNRGLQANIVKLLKLCDQ